MTDTTFPRAKPGYRAPSGIALPVWISRRLRRLLGILNPAIRAAAAEGLGRRFGASATSPVLRREIETIDSFSRFLGAHPDMPLEHRERFLIQIRRSCAEVRWELC